jgi:hypothetical protein
MALAHCILGTFLGVGCQPTRKQRREVAQLLYFDCSFCVNVNYINTFNFYNKNTDSPFSEQTGLCYLRKCFLFTLSITHHLNILCGENTGFSILVRVKVH